MSLVTQECVDHHDTDTPHTHIIARGLRANAHDLVLPRDFIKHSFHSLARTALIDALGARVRLRGRLSTIQSTPPRVGMIRQASQNVPVREISSQIHFAAQIFPVR
jgi:type IV secretory pathway VirD2 relaxase